MIADGPRTSDYQERDRGTTFGCARSEVIARHVDPGHSDPLGTTGRALSLRALDSAHACVYQARVATTNDPPLGAHYIQACASLEVAIALATEHGVEAPARYRRLDDALTDPDYADDFAEHLQRWELRKSQDCVTALVPTVLPTAGSVPIGQVRRAHTEAIVARHLRTAAKWATEHASLLRQSKSIEPDQAQHGAAS